MSSDFSDLYYPNGWKFLGQLLLIIILYIPSFAMVFLNLRMTNTCIRRVHPHYDFKNKQLYVKGKSPGSGPSSPTNDERKFLTRDRNEDEYE